MVQPVYRIIDKHAGVHANQSSKRHLDCVWSLCPHFCFSGVVGDGVVAQERHRVTKGCCEPELRIKEGNAGKSGP